MVDCKVNGMAKPLYVFALTATTEHAIQQSQIHSFENGALLLNLWQYLKIKRTSTGRFSQISDVCDKQSSNLEANKQRIITHVQELIRWNRRFYPWQHWNPEIAQNGFLCSRNYPSNIVPKATTGHISARNGQLRKFPAFIRRSKKTCFISSQRQTADYSCACAWNS